MFPKLETQNLLVLRKILKWLTFFFLPFTAEYLDASHCRPCHSTCETCVSGGEQGCLTCPSSLLLQDGKCLPGCLDGTYMEQGQCVPCLHTCKTCVSRLNCTTCETGLQLQSGECRAACADGYVTSIPFLRRKTLFK